jgi:hypothetical protein
MLRLDSMGAQVVLHTHDDINVEGAVERGEASRAAMQEVMRTLPSWAAGFPLKADVKLMRRYGK